MNIGIFNYYTEYNYKNSVFNPASYKIGEGLEYPLVKLKEEFEAHGNTFSTIDMYPINEYQKIIFYDYPNLKDIDIKKLYNMGIDLYLIVVESSLVKPDNWDKNNHKYFKKVFCWDESYIDNTKYFLYKLPNRINYNYNYRPFSVKKFCTLIAGNKKSKHPFELYSERIRAIRWFEKKHPDEFDLFGIGWDTYVFGKSYAGRFLNLLNKSNIIVFFKNPYPSYRGRIDLKLETLGNYKFSICYENASGFNGYITEKIFDCFNSGCIPIYLGATNITDYIPAGCFIDRRNFSNYEELYLYMKDMTDSDYSEYLHNISSFLHSEKAYPFSTECFVETIIKEILT